MASYRDSRPRSRSRDRDRNHHESSRRYPRSPKRSSENRSRSSRDDSIRPSHGEYDNSRYTRDTDDRREKRTRRERERDTPSDDEDLLDLADLGVRPISEDDYFLKSTEFKYWLKHSRRKEFTDMSSETSRRYFQKFVRRWNDGALREKYYGLSRQTGSISRREVPSSSTGSPYIGNGHDHHRDRRQPDIHDDVDDDDDNEQVGPSLPTRPLTHSDRQLQLETEAQDRKAALKADRRTKLAKVEEMVPRGVGKEGKMAEKKATNASNKEMRDRGGEVGGLEVDDGVLMGEGSSFAAAKRARDLAEARRAEKRENAKADRRAGDEERLAERRQKENSTMEMLRAMAKQRFG